MIKSNIHILYRKLQKIFVFCVAVLFVTHLSAQSVVDFTLIEFKEEGDSLSISYQIKVPAFPIQSAQQLRMFPVLQTPDSLCTLDGIHITGANKQKVVRRFKKDSSNTLLAAEIGQDTLLYFNHNIPYEMWMDTASLTLWQEITEYRNKSTASLIHLNDQVKLATREPYQVKPVLALMAPKKEIKVRKRQGKAFLDFQVGRTEIVPTYRRNPVELAKIYNDIRVVVNNPDAAIEGLYIEGYASPDGAYATNERLSRERAESLKNYILTRFNFNRDLLRVSSVAEDWEGLTNLIQDSDMAEKEDLLQIIQTEEDLDKAEDYLQQAAYLACKEAEKNLHELQLKREDNIRQARYTNRK